MATKPLFVLIEGDDDERFLKTVIESHFSKRQYVPIYWKYAQKKDEKVMNFIKSIKSMRVDYIYLQDINKAPCVTEKKAKIKKSLKNRIDEEKVFIVIKEIESWYLAGIDQPTLNKMHINLTSKNMDNITKEKFNQLIPEKMPRIDFMVRLLEGYIINFAKKNNKSFKYFLRKL